MLLVSTVPERVELKHAPGNVLLILSPSGRELLDVTNTSGGDGEKMLLALLATKLVGWEGPDFGESFSPEAAARLDMKTLSAAFAWMAERVARPTSGASAES